MASVTAAAFSPILGPSDKERKYDRQLRLWAASGQAALEHANVLLVNSGSGVVGVEALKNLVLPGIGSFTIYDEALVTDNDLGCNFFLDETVLGQSRAECCTNYLLELNPGVNGDYSPKAQSNADLRGLLDSTDTFTIILYALPLKAEYAGLIEQYAQTHSAPLVAAHAVGFYSYFSLRLSGIFPIVDTHPDEDVSADLRLLHPWPELSTFACQAVGDIDNLDDFDHGHLPLIVILLHYLSIWRSTHADAYPSTYRDKIAFRAMIYAAMRRNNAEGGEENFEEAISAVMKSVTPFDIPGPLKQVFSYCGDTEPRPHSHFWLIAKAVHRFYSNHGQLPLPGNLPDMKAESNVYVKLQAIYKDKARRDIQEVLASARSMAGGTEVGQDEVELFCKNARFVRLVNVVEDRTAIANQLIEKEIAKYQAAVRLGQETPQSLFPIYLALTAAEHVSNTTADNIMSYIVARVPALAGDETVMQVAHEISRVQGGELHNVSAATGGMIAQEIIKIITTQYVPVDNTCVFNAVQGCCEVFRL
ncbi:hypothetical protein CDD83_5240 [Cordyceps sp. RAO-2017]|nr:hypothetical protein CDD83_5240 [Cordyceps sp. RAO-2017]